MAAVILAAGYPALAVAVLFGALGVPLPLGATLCAAGALAREGHADLTLLFATSVGAAVAGDSLGYAAGRFGARWFRPPVRRTERSRRWHHLPAWPARLQVPMGQVVFLTRWALTVAGPLVNVVAGARRYPWHYFLFFDLAGQALWTAAVLGAGFGLGASSEGGMWLAVGAGLVLSLAGAAASRYQHLGAPSGSRHA